MKRRLLLWVGSHLTYPNGRVFEFYRRARQDEEGSDYWVDPYGNVWEVGE